MKKKKSSSLIPFLGIYILLLILFACGDSEYDYDSDSDDESESESINPLTPTVIQMPAATSVPDAPVNVTPAIILTPLPMPSIAPVLSPPLPPAPIPPLPPRISVFSIGTDQAHPPLRNKKGDLGTSRETGIEIRSGDLVEIRPTALTQEKRRPPEMKVARVDNDVCVKTADVCVANEPVFERRCDDQCRVCVKCHPFPPSCHPWRCCDNVCQDVKVGERCVRTEQHCTQRENRWKELTTYSGLGESQMIKNPSPMTDSPLLMSGLKLKFTYPASPSFKEVICTLSQFKPEMDNERIIVTVDNVEGCTIFPKNLTKGYPILSLVNEMNAPMSYLQGSLIKTWDGRLLEQPTESVFYPIIDFLGVITVRAPDAPQN